jgi:hypothetical protein
VQAKPSREKPTARTGWLQRQLAGDELLPAVDVVGRASEGGVGHDMYGERGDVGRVTTRRMGSAARS